MKYFGNVYVFNEIFQNAMPWCSTCFCRPNGPLYIFLVMRNCLHIIMWY